MVSSDRAVDEPYHIQEGGPIDEHARVTNSFVCVNCGVGPLSADAQRGDVNCPVSIAVDQTL